MIVDAREVERALIRLLRMLGLPESTPFKTLGPRMQNLVFDLAAETHGS